MDKAELITRLCEIENFAIRWATQSYVCGAHDIEENRKKMQDADSNFSNSILNLRLRIAEGVSE